MMMIVMNIILYWRSLESEEIWTFAACHIFWSLRDLHSETVAVIPPNLLTVAVYDRPKPHSGSGRISGPRTMMTIFNPARVQKTSLLGDRSHSLHRMPSSDALQSYKLHNTLAF